MLHTRSSAPSATAGPRWTPTATSAAPAPQPCSSCGKMPSFSSGGDRRPREVQSRIHTMRTQFRLLAAASAASFLSVSALAANHDVACEVTTVPYQTSTLLFRNVQLSDVVGLKATSYVTWGANAFESYAIDTIYASGSTPATGMSSLPTAPPSPSRFKRKPIRDTEVRSWAFCSLN